MTWAWRPTAKRRWYSCKLHGTSTKVCDALLLHWYGTRKISNMYIYKIQIEQTRFVNTKRRSVPQYQCYRPLLSHPVVVTECSSSPLLHCYRQSPYNSATYSTVLQQRHTPLLKYSVAGPFVAPRCTSHLVGNLYR